MVAIVFGAMACGGSPPLIGVDGGRDAAGDQVVDTVIEAYVTLPNCQSARAVCDGKNVLACVAGQTGNVIQICEEACSLGRCTTRACQEIENSDGVRGCRFYGVQTDNIDSDDSRSLMLILSNAGSAPAAARVEVRDPGGQWTQLTSALVPGGGAARLEINRPLRDPGVTLAGAFRVETDSPVFAVQIVSNDADQWSRSSGGSVLRPVQALGFRHLAVTSPAAASPEVVRTPGSRGGAGVITVIATVAATHVTVGLSASATIVPGGQVDPPMPFGVPLDEGDVLQIFSATPEGDLTGTSIDADAPLAVFSGNVYTSYGYAVVGFAGADFVQEQLPPTASWGMAYVGARLSPQAGCDPFFGTGAGSWRVIAAADNTDVTLVPARGVSIDGPNIPRDLAFKLARGESRSFFARPDHVMSTTSDIFVRASNPILLAQWLDCEPALAWGIDSRLAGGLFNFSLAPGFDHELVVVRATGSVVTFDGLALPDMAFRSVAESGFEAARLSSTDIGRCLDVFDRCEHKLSGASFAASWRGMDVTCSYALTVPPGNICALPNVVGCVE